MVHTASVEHRGVLHDVEYRPQTRVEMKTVGTAAGARPTTQRCVWTMTVAVERSIRGAEGHAISAAMLPEIRRFSGSRAGDCAMARRGVQTQQRLAMREVRQHVARLASADRDEALAALDAAGHPRA